MFTFRRDRAREAAGVRDVAVRVRGGFRPSCAMDMLRGTFVVARPEVVS